MPRPSTSSGFPAPWVSNPDGTAVPGAAAYDTDTDQLPPLTAAIRQAWGTHTPHPVASSASMAAIFNAVHQLELRVAALES